MLQSTSSKDTGKVTQQLIVAKSWVRQWHPQAKIKSSEKPVIPFLERTKSDEYVEAKPFHFNNLILGGKFPAAQDTLGGLNPKETAVMDVLDPHVEKIDHVHVDGVSQVLIDINVMTDEEAKYLRGDKGIDHVIQSNIGGPNEIVTSILEAGQKWVSGSAPGCSCLICARVPEVVKKLQSDQPLTPSDVLPLTTIPRLHDVVDTMLQPSVKIALGSQGRISEDTYQEYPSAAVGHMSYQEKTNQSIEIPLVSEALDPKNALGQFKAPKGYDYVKGFFWEKDKTMKRKADDPDRHAFGFIYVKKDAKITETQLQSEKKRFKPSLN